MASSKEKEILGLNSEATDAEVMAKIAKLTEYQAEKEMLLNKLDAKNASEAVAKIEALLKQSAQNAGAENPVEEYMEAQALQEIAKSVYESHKFEEMFISRVDGNILTDAREATGREYVRVAKGKIVD